MEPIRRPARLLIRAVALFVVAAFPGTLPGWCVSTLTGWPKATGHQVRGSAALGDLDGDGDLEVIIGSFDNKVYAWHHDGTAVTGWPVTTLNWVESSPSLGDLDGDGAPEVVVGSYDGNVYAWHGDRSALAGWPQATGNTVQSSPALGDLDGDGDLEVIVGSFDYKVYAWHHDGTAVTGWPKTTGAAVGASPALGDLDGDGDLDVVVGSNDHNVYAWHGDGSAVTGWPQTAGHQVHASAALGDLDGDGHLEVVVGCADYKVYAWHHDGTAVTGWPQTTLGEVVHPSLGDLDGDGDLEVLAGSFDHYVYAWHGNGTPVTGWPQVTGWSVVSVPAFADLDGDGGLEVVIGSTDSKVHAWHGDGSVVSGWPQTTGGQVWSSPSVADLDGDGDLEVVVGSNDYSVYAWTCEEETGDPKPWPMWRHDVRHSGRYSGVTVLSSGYVTPGAGDPATRFTYRVKCWNTAGEKPTRVMLALWSPGGLTWRPMWEYDPSDRNLKDGKWYTYHTHLHGGNYAFRFAAEVNGAWTHWPRPAGAYAAGPTVSPVLLSGGYVMPASGTHGQPFTWRIRYWNTSNAAPDEVWCAIWFPTLKRTYWHLMLPYDPGDTNYLDGAWYTFSRRWLPPGAYAYRFAARQGSHWAYWPRPAGTYAAGPTVNP